MFFPIKSYMQTKKIDFIDEPVIYSSNSILLSDLKTNHCIDKNLSTSCFEICKPVNINKTIDHFLFLNKNECGFVIQISPTHIMYKNPPEKNVLSRFGVYISKRDLEYNIPKKIKLQLYEQQLYHINRDYRFPDQPTYSDEIELTVQKKEGWQFWDIQKFNNTIKDSNGFPEHIKQRWLKIIIEELYESKHNKISITEFYYQDLFFSPNEYR